TRGEYSLLKELVGSPGQVLSRDQLCHAIAGRGADPFERSIDVLVARLRQKVEPNPKSPRYITTVPGAGYKLVARRQSGDGQPSRAESSEPERRQVTVLSCGVVDAVALAANFDPEDLVSSMRTFQHSCTGVIGGMDGMIFTHS